MVIRKKAGERNSVPAARSSMSETGVRENGMVMEHTQNTAKKLRNLVKDTWVSLFSGYIYKIINFKNS